MATLYVLESQGFYKIGYAEKFNSRLSSIKTGNPFDINVVFKFEDNNPIEIERYLHSKFKDKRHKGEWFSLLKNDVDEIIKESIDGFGRIKKKINKYLQPTNCNFSIINQNQTLFAKEIGEDYKYLSAFFDIIMFDNSFHLSKFQELCGINPSNFSRLKKRLIDKGIIAENKGIFYLNPAIAIRSDIISYELMDLFKDINSKLYGITEL